MGEHGRCAAMSPILGVAVMCWGVRQRSASRANPRMQAAHRAQDGVACGCDIEFRAFGELFYRDVDADADAVVAGAGSPPRGRAVEFGRRGGGGREVMH